MQLNSLQQLYFLLNATILITHQIDSAYWHEWELFHIPGGNQVNLLLNLPIIALVLYAQAQVAVGTRKSVAYYKLIATLGFLTAMIHSGFFLSGSEAFIQPMSIALLVATLVFSTLQILTLHKQFT